MLLTSKITIPDSPAGIIDRTRLYQQLDGWRAYRGVLIQAPTGYGKSTLASRWIERAGLGERAAWLSLAEEDSEPRRFVQYVAAALDRCLPGVAETIAPVLKDPKSNARRALERLLGVLQEEFLAGEARADTHVLLVLDDLQRVRSAEVDRFILQMLEFGPEALHLMLVTRQQTDLPLARLYAQGKILALDKEDLRFTEEEVAAYFVEHGVGSLLAEDVARLTERSEGWVAALQLALLSLDRRAGVAALQRALLGSEQWLAQYLVDEVLARQDAERRRFLQQTAILERFNASLCAAVTGMEDAAAQLAGIARADLFLIPLDREEGWFRYHQLFQELLQKRLQEETSAGDIAVLQRRAGRWLADHGEYEAALRHLLAGGVEEAAADLLEGIMRRLIVRDHFAALRLFQLLPEHLCRERPQLALDRAFLAVVLDEPQQESYVSQAREALDAYRPLDGEHADWQGEWLVLQSGVFLQKGKLQAAAEGISQASAYVAVLDDLAAGLMWYIDFGIRRLRAEQTGCLASAQRAIHHFERADMLLGSIAVQRNVARWRMERGDSGAANQLFQTLLEDLPDGRPETFTEAALCFFYAAENAYWQNDLERARAQLETLLVMAEQLRDPALICCARIMGVLYAEDGAASELPARQTYDELEQASAASEFLKVVILDIRRLTAAGRGEEAWQAAQKLGIDLARAADVYDHPLAILIPYLQALIARGKDLPAVTAPLAGAVEHYAARGLRFLQLQLLVLLAWQRLQLEGEAAARESLSEAVQLAEETGYGRALLVIPELQGLLGNLWPAEQTVVHPLSRRETEVLELLADGRTYGEMSAALSISVNTVRSHVRQVYRKLAVHRRRDAIAAARRERLIR